MRVTTITRGLLALALVGGATEARPQSFIGAGPAERRFRIEAVAESDRSGRYLVCIAKEESLA